MPDVILPYLKAWAAFIGAILQVLIPFLPLETSVSHWTQAVVAVLTAIAVFGVPNQPVVVVDNTPPPLPLAKKV